MSETQKNLFVGCPNVGDLDIFYDRTKAILNSRRFSNNGPVVQELENKLQEYLGVRHCIAICNATVGLQVCAHALGLTGEVITTPYTFVATSHALYWEGIRPVFIDVDSSTHNIDPESVEAAITKQTSGILGVHVWGRPCFPQELRKIADRHGLHLMFDAAHAFGCAHNGQMIGNFGECEVFSFHATKFFNTFEGGAIATNDDNLAAKIRLMINFGFSGMDNVVHLGTNAKMSEIHAAMGVACFSKLNDILSINRSHYALYRERLKALPGISLYEYDDLSASNCQYVVLEINSDECSMDRDAIVSELHAENIIARRYFYPCCHRMEPYATLYADTQKPLPKAESLASRTLVLPTGSSITAEDVNRVCDRIESLVS